MDIDALVKRNWLKLKIISVAYIFSYMIIIFFNLDRSTGIVGLIIRILVLIAIIIIEKKDPKYENEKQIEIDFIINRIYYMILAIYLFGYIVTRKNDIISVIIIILLIAKKIISIYKNHKKTKNPPTQ